MKELLPDEEVRKKNIETFERISRIHLIPDGDESERFHMILAGDGSPVLAERLQDGALHIYGSTYSPQYEAERWAAGFSFSNRRTTIAMLGYGCGYQLAALLKLTRPDTHFFIYEPDIARLAFICAFFDLSPVFGSERIHFYTSPGQYVSFVNDLEKDVAYNSFTAQAIRTPGYMPDPLFDSACDQIATYTLNNEGFRRHRNRGAARNRFHAWLRLHHNSMLYDLLKDLPVDLPVIVVAGGPSLLKNVELLRDAKDHALIVCIDRAVSILDRLQIKPDILVTVDAHKNPEYLRSENLGSIPLMCSFQTDPATQDLFDGRMIMFHAWHYEKLLPEAGDKVLLQGGLGGNVASAAYSTFMKAGFRNIILIGQDLANLGDQTHADGLDDGASINTEFIEIDGIDGGKVLSHRDWISFRDYYERMILTYPDTHLIDATEGGALIHGSEVLTLRQALDKYCTKEYPVSSWLSDLPKAQTEEGHAATVKLIRKWADDLDEISSVARDLSDLTRQLLKTARYQDITDPKVNKKLSRLDELRLKVMKKDIYQIFKEYWVLDVYSIPDHTFMIRNNEEAVPVFEQALSYYEKLPEDCASLKAMILEELNLLS